MIAPMPLIEKEYIDEFACLYQFYKVQSEDEIISFIRKHPFLLPILVDAPVEIYRIFPRDDVKLELELHHDSEEDYDELFVVIKSPYSPQKARKSMDKLDETWFLEIMDRTKNKLCITEEPL
ncbi:MAG: hypothetical protein QME49_03200 [bacterium]|nr:hypothetical protein [bacterium]